MPILRGNSSVTFAQSRGTERDSRVTTSTRAFQLVALACLVPWLGLIYPAHASLLWERNATSTPISSRLQPATDDNDRYLSLSRGESRWSRCPSEAPFSARRPLVPLFTADKKKHEGLLCFSNIPTIHPNVQRKINSSLFGYFELQTVLPTEYASSHLSSRFHLCDDYYLSSRSTLTLQRFHLPVLTKKTDCGNYRR